jgi:hypothetical protein
MLEPMNLGGAFAFVDSGAVISVTEARDKLTELIAETKEGRFPVIGRYREPGAVLVAPGLARLLPILIATMAADAGRDLATGRRDRPGEPVYLLGDPWPFIAQALWQNGHRAMFAQFASDTLGTTQQHDTANNLPRMTVEEFLRAMPMTLGGDLPDAEVDRAIAFLQECLPSMNPPR